MPSGGKPKPPKDWAYMESRSVPMASGCREWDRTVGQNRYGNVHHLGTHMHAHRVAWLVKFGGIPDGLYVCHHCDNKSCVNPDHLYLGTPKDNMRDAWERCPKHMRVKGGRPKVRASYSPATRITAADALEIRRRAAAGERACKLAEEHGVHRAHISKIVNGHIWKQPDADLREAA